MKVIFELLLVAILVICAWQGYKKGVIMGIFGLLVIVVSLYGANLLSTTFSYEVIPAMKPFISGYMEKICSNVTGEDAIEETGWSMEDYLSQHPEEQKDFCVRVYRQLGLYTGAAEQMAWETLAAAEEQGDGIRSAIISVTCDRVAYLAGFMLAFVMVLILLTVLLNIPNLGLKLPGLNTVDAVGGTVLGLLTGFFYCVILCWAIRFFGLLFAEETIARGGLAGWLINKNYLMPYIGI